MEADSFLVGVLIGLLLPPAYPRIKTLVQELLKRKGL